MPSSAYVISDSTSVVERSSGYAARFYDDFVYMIDEKNEASIVVIDSRSATHIDIPSKLEDCPVTGLYKGTHPYTGDEYNVFEGFNELKSVSLPDTITYIDEGGFRDCKSLVSVELPESLEYVLNYTFENCTSLEEVYIPSTISIIAEDAFKNCPKLKTIKTRGSSNGINRWVNAHKDLGITVVDLDNGGSSTETSDTDIYEKQNTPYTSGIFTYMLGNVEGTEVTIVDINTTGQKKIEVPSEIRGKKVTSINRGIGSTPMSLFENSADLEEVVIPNTVAYLGKGAFENCKKLTKVTVSNGIKNYFASTFKNCSSLKSITLPDTVEYIEDTCFEGCADGFVINHSGKSQGINRYLFSHKEQDGRKKSTDTDTSSKPVDTDTSTKPVDTDTSSKPVDTDTSLKPVDTDTSSKPIDTDTSSKPVDTDTSSKPVTDTDIHSDVSDTDSKPVDTDTSTSAKDSDTNGDVVDTDTSSKPVDTDTAGRVTSDTDNKPVTSDTDNKPVVSDSDTDNKPVTSDTDTNPVDTDSKPATSDTDTKPVDTDSKPADTDTGTHTSSTVKFSDIYAYIEAEDGSITIVGINSGSRSSVSIPERLDGKKVTKLVRGIMDGESLTLFENNTSITSVSIPDTVTYIDKGAFENCTNLKTVDFSENVQQLNDNLFKGCKNLEEVELGNVTYISDSAFDGCSDSFTIVHDGNSQAINRYLFTHPDQKNEVKGAQSDVVEGDVDGDGSVTSADALMVLRVSVGLDTINGSSYDPRFDVDGDDSVTSADALKILRVSVGLETF